MIALSLSKKIGVHDPAMRCARLCPDAHDLFRDVAEFSGDQDFVFGAEIGAPVDIERMGIEMFERETAVQHHDGGVHVVREPFPQFAPCGDLERIANRVERDAVTGGERLDTGDAGNYLMPECKAGRLRQSVNDAQRAVVKRWITPDQECDGPIVTGLGQQQAAIGVGNGVMPVVNLRLKLGLTH